MKGKKFLFLLFILCPVLCLFAGCFEKPKPTYISGINLNATFDNTSCEDLDIDVGYRLAFVDDKYGDNYVAKDVYYNETPNDISGSLALDELCFEDLNTAKNGYELKDMIVYFDINNNSEYPISVSMEVTNEVSNAKFTFDCEQIGYIQEKDKNLDVQTQTAAFRVRYDNAEKVSNGLKDVELKLTFTKLEPIADTEGVFTYTFDGETKTAVVASYTDSTGEITDVKIPRTVINEEDRETYVVTELAGALFRSNATIKNVWLPDTLKKVGESAFLLTTSIDAVYIPDGVEYIAHQAFGACGFKGSLYLPEGLIKFNYIHGSFATLDDSYKYEGKSALAQMPNVEKIVFSEGIEFLPVQLLYKNTNLKEIIFPTTLKEIYGYYAAEDVISMTATFRDCVNLVEIDLYNTQYETFGYRTFYGCTGLKNVYLGKKHKYIGNQDFYNCTSLEKVKMSKFVNKIDIGAFSSCSNLKYIDLPTSLREIGYCAFQYCKKLEKIEIPEGVEFISDFAFNHCCHATNKTIKLPTTIKQIGGRTYDPQNPQQNIIGSHVFYNCATDNLTAFEISSKNPYYMTVDGVLYRKENGVPTVLVAYPASKTNSVYVMPNTVRDAYELSMSRPYYLDEIVLSDSFVISVIEPSETKTYINENWANNLSAMLYIYNSVTKITCNLTNENYKSVNGQVYSKDGKILYFAPVYTANEGETLYLAEGVETIFAGAIANESNRESTKNDDNLIDDNMFLYRYDYIVIPNTVTSIGDITISAINAQSWGITIEEGNTVYTVNGSGDIAQIA